MDQVVEQLMLFATDYGLRIVGGIAILVGGWFVSRWLAGFAAAAVKRARPSDETMGPIARRVVRIVVMLLVVLVLLDNFGVETASIITVLGAAGLAIGLALQGTLSNVASGLMLLTLRPFRAADIIEVAGVVGTVVEIRLFTTKIKTRQGTLYYIPNAKVWSDKIHNLTEAGTRRLDLAFGIAYHDDMDRAIAVVREVLDKEPRVLAEPAAVVAIGQLSDSAVQVFVRPWVKPADYGPAELALTKRIKERFDEAGISIPFPQRDVHLREVTPRVA